MFVISCDDQQREAFMQERGTEEVEEQTRAMCNLWESPGVVCEGWPHTVPKAVCEVLRKRLSTPNYNHQ